MDDIQLAPRQCNSEKSADTTDQGREFHRVRLAWRLLKEEQRYGQTDVIERLIQTIGIRDGVNGYSATQ
jgi:hypothetical protein